MNTPHIIAFKFRPCLPFQYKFPQVYQDYFRALQVRPLCFLKVSIRSPEVVIFPSLCHAFQAIEQQNPDLWEI